MVDEDAIGPCSIEWRPSTGAEDVPRWDWRDPTQVQATWARTLSNYPPATLRMAADAISRGMRAVAADADRVRCAGAQQGRAAGASARAAGAEAVGRGDSGGAEQMKAIRALAQATKRYPRMTPAYKTCAHSSPGRRRCALDCAVVRALADVGGEGVRDWLREPGSDDE